VYSKPREIARPGGIRAFVCFAAIASAALAYGPSAGAAFRTPGAVYRPPDDARLTLSADERKVLRRLNAARRARGLPPLKSEARLARVARRHSEEMRRSDFFGYVSPTRGSLREQVLRAGVSATMLRFQICRVNRLDNVIRRLDETGAPPYLEQDTHIGVGVVRWGLPRRYLVTLIFLRCQARLEPFPMQVRPGERRRLAGTLAKGLREPGVSVLPPGASVVRLPVEIGADGRFGTVVAFDRGRGEYIVEVVARGPLGPTVTDLMKVYAGVPFPKPRRPEADDDTLSAREAEVLMVRLLNEDRRRHELKPLRVSGALREVARAHSRDMMVHRFFAHVSPTRGSLAKRIQAARVTLESYAENIATDTSIRRAQRLLMESPEHRKNILCGEFDVVGVGIVRSRTGQFFITQEFGRAQRQVKPEVVARSLLEGLNALRRRAGLNPLGRDPALDGIAQANSRAMMVAGRLSLDTANALLRRHLKRGRATTLVLASTAVPEVGQLKMPRIEDMKGFSRVGIGPVENREAATGRPRWWTTVVLVAD